MGIIIFDKNGNEVMITHAVDVPAALASGNYFKEDPTKRKKVKVVKPEEEKPEPAEKKEEEKEEEPKEEPRKPTWRDKVAEEDRKR